MKKTIFKSTFVVALFIILFFYCFTIINNNIDYSKLKSSIDNNDMKRFEDLLKSGANPNASNAYTYSGIIEQLGEGKHKIFTIFHYAAYVGHDEALNLLLDYGADPNFSPPSAMYSALTRVVMNDENNIKLSTVKILVNNGADVNCIENNQHLLYWLIYNYSPYNSYGYDDVEIFKFLVECGADVYSGNYLLIASQMGKGDIVKYLIGECRYKVNGGVELFEYCEATVNLSQAIFDEEIFNYFVENGADIDEIVKDGMSVRDFLNANELFSCVDIS